MNRFNIYDHAQVREGGGEELGSKTERGARARAGTGTGERGGYEGTEGGSIGSEYGEVRALYPRLQPLSPRTGRVGRGGSVAGWLGRAGGFLLAPAP